MSCSCFRGSRKPRPARSQYSKLRQSRRSCSVSLGCQQQRHGSGAGSSGAGSGRARRHQRVPGGHDGQRQEHRRTHARPCAQACSPPQLAPLCLVWRDWHTPASRPSIRSQRPPDHQAAPDDTATIPCACLRLDRDRTAARREVRESCAACALLWKHDSIRRDARRRKPTLTQVAECTQVPFLRQRRAGGAGGGQDGGRHLR